GERGGLRSRTLAGIGQHVRRGRRGAGHGGGSGAAYRGPPRARPCGEWGGGRHRLWAMLLQPAGDLMVEVRTTMPDRPRLDVQPDPDTTILLHLVLYAGPVEQHRLVAVDPVLAGLLMPGLWEWLRLLGFGMHHLLERWHDL